MARFFDAFFKKDLFSSYNMAGRYLKNRIALAPMTRARVRDNLPMDEVATYYAQRASAGLMVTECLAITQQAQSSFMVPGIWRDDQIEAWKNVNAKVREAGGVLFAQIWHAGRVSHDSLQPGGAPPVSSTNKAMRDNDFKICLDAGGGKVDVVPASKPRGLATEEIPGITQDFVTAAENAMKANFDGVELHAANGYLFEQFFNPNINDRADCYGGSIENRLRFFIETVDAVIARVGAPKVGVRLSPYSTRLDNAPYDETERTYLRLARLLSHRNIAYVSFNDEGNPDGTRTIPESFYKKFRAEYSGTIMAAGQMTRQEAERMLNSGGAWPNGGVIDLAAFGRPFIGNPDLVRRLKNRWPLVEAPRETFFGGDAKGYTDWPTYDPKQGDSKSSVSASEPKKDAPKKVEEKASKSEPKKTKSDKPESKEAETKRAESAKPAEKVAVEAKAEKPKVEAKKAEPKVAKPTEKKADAKSTTAKPSPDQPAKAPEKSDAKSPPAASNEPAKAPEPVTKSAAPAAKPAVQPTPAPAAAKKESKAPSTTAVKTPAPSKAASFSKPAEPVRKPEAKPAAKPSTSATKAAPAAKPNVKPTATAAPLPGGFKPQSPLLAKPGPKSGPGADAPPPPFVYKPTDKKG